MNDLGAPLLSVGDILWTPSQVRQRDYFEKCLADAESRGDVGRVEHCSRVLDEIEAEVKDSQPEHRDCHECQVFGDRLNCSMCEFPASKTLRCPQHNLEHRRDVHGVQPIERFCQKCGVSVGFLPKKRSVDGGAWCARCP